LVSRKHGVARADQKTLPVQTNEVPIARAFLAHRASLSVDVLAHPEALRSALVDGPLTLVLHSLAARAAVDPELGSVRDRLTDEGCAPIRQIVSDAKIRGVVDPRLLNRATSATFRANATFRNDGDPGADGPEQAV
jgi:hypothetical protein